MAKKASAKRALSSLSVSELASELQRRARQLGPLEEKRAALVEQINGIDGEIEMLRAAAGVSGGGRGGARRGRPGRAAAGPRAGKKKKRGGGRGGRRGGRGRNEMNLVDALAQVLTDQVMSVTDVSEAVQRAGYKTSSPNFRTIVNQALISSGRFKRVARGQYTTKK